jgi:hypothetical protein
LVRIRCLTNDLVRREERLAEDFGRLGTAGQAHYLFGAGGAVGERDVADTTGPAAAAAQVIADDQRHAVVPHAQVARVSQQQREGKLKP